MASPYAPAHGRSGDHADQLTGTLVRTVDEISVSGPGRVRLIRLDEGERLVGIERVESLETPEEGAAAGEGPEQAAGESAADPPP
jgi:hypothetical protein